MILKLWYVVQPNEMKSTQSITGVVRVAGVADAMPALLELDDEQPILTAATKPATAIHRRV
ncbi:MAG TPA: hypothetical protein EYM27_04770 [Dehalococcoidia bacterium]|nr:hypothetical protein [Dehalococcoidia bacterium]